MRASLMRTGSTPVNQQFVTRHNSVGELFSGNGNGERASASRISLNVRSSDRSPVTCVGMRRALSDSDFIRSERVTRDNGFKPLPVKIPEESKEEEEMEFTGGGLGRGSGDSGSNGKRSRGGGYNDRSKIGQYYKEMLKSNPNNSLLLLNYGRFLYEVEEDAERAEEYYGRAILESPSDGEALSMYGKLIWETERDEERAKGYFDQALNASPHDCMVLGSYAHFMWDADEDDEDDKEVSQLPPTMVTAV